MVALITMPVLPASQPKKNISPAELSQRVAVIKRFKELLKSQRERFQAYLTALDLQKDVIEGGSAEDLLQHVELEEKIVADIFSIQKVIDPLESMYRSARAETGAADGSVLPGSVLPGSTSVPPSTSAEAPAEEISSLKNALEGLKAEAVLRSERNRELLAKRMAELRSEIKILKNNAYARRNINTGNVPSLVDIKG